MMIFFGGGGFKTEKKIRGATVSGSGSFRKLYTGLWRVDGFGVCFRLILMTAARDSGPMIDTIGRRDQMA